MKLLKKNKIAPIIILVFLVFTTPQSANAQEILHIGKFSKALPDKKNLPKHWEPMTFDKINRHTKYELIKENDITIIKAESKNSASGLIRKILIDPEKYPIIEWKWKITNVYKNADITKKQGDDYPARIYIAFNPLKANVFEKAKFTIAKTLFKEHPPINAINYIWSSKAKKGTITFNPYTKRVKMIVVQSKNFKQNKWITEKRNVYKDYIKAFGYKPPMISGVAIMTDSDNTKESAVTYYGDIVFKKEGL